MVLNTVKKQIILAVAVVVLMFAFVFFMNSPILTGLVIEDGGSESSVSEASIESSVVKDQPKIDEEPTKPDTTIAKKPSSSIDPVIKKPINITEVDPDPNRTTIYLEASQIDAVINEKVKWEKTEEIKEYSDAIINLPLSAENFSISYIGEEDISARQEEQDKDKKEIKISTQNKRKIVKFEYYTPAPITREEIVGNKKIIHVSSPDDVHYENVLVYTNLNESMNAISSDKIKIYWEENETYISPHSLQDRDANGVYDYLEFIAPHLSNQTFQIIIITQAEHLDENRNFISDIYSEVRYLDGLWSETILDTHYVRVTFEHNLTNTNDITIYPRIISGNPRIEIYEHNKSEIIATFSDIVSNEYNKVYLDNLQGSQDTFDLMILNGDLEFDHIIDPITTGTLIPRLEAGNQNVSSGALTEMTYAYSTGALISGACYGQINITPTLTCLENEGTNLLDPYFTWNITLPAYDKLYSVYLRSIAQSFAASTDKLNISLFNFTSGAFIGVNQSGTATVGVNTTLLYNVTGGFIDNFVGSSHGGQTIVFMSHVSGTNTVDMQQEFFDARVVYEPFANPAVFLIAPPNNTITSSSVWSFNATATDNFNVSNMTFYLWNTTGLVNQTTTATTGTGSGVNLSVTLPHNELFSWNYLACDSASNCVFNSTNFTINYDNAGPTLVYVSPTDNDGAFESRNYIEINLTTSASDLGTITIKLFNSTAQVNSSTSLTSPFYTNFTSLANGLYFYNATANDTSGNVANLATRNITLDTIKPIISFISPTPSNNSNTVNSLITINVSATDMNLINITIYIINSSGSVVNTSSSNNNEAIFFTDLKVNGEGTYYFNASSTDLANNGNNTETRTLNVDNSVPKTFLIAPPNNTITSAAAWSFNATFSDNFALSNATFYLWNLTSIVNQTTHLLSGASSAINFSVTLPHQGRFYWNYLTADNVSNRAFNSTNFTILYDASSPKYDNVTEFPADPATYSLNGEYDFNISWLDSLSDINTVLLEFNGTNYSATAISNNRYNASVLNFAAGAYNYYWIANDSAGNSNRTVVFTYTITKAASQVNTYLNHNRSNITINQGSSIYLNGTTVSGEGAIQLYLNGTPINQGSSPLSNLTTFNTLGLFNVSTLHPATQNYTSSTETFYVTVVIGDTEYPTFSAFNENPVNGTSYVNDAAYKFNVTILATNGTAGIEFNGVNYSVYNVSGIPNIFNFTINDLGAGAYNYYWWAYGNGSNHNYNTSAIRSYTVTQATGDVEIYLNGTAGNITVELGRVVTINASRITGEGTFTLYLNGTVIAIGTGTTNTTTITSLPSRNITATLAATQNFTSETLFRSIDVVDSTIPQIQIVYPLNTTYASVQTLLNYTVFDYALGTCWYSTNGGVTNTTVTCGTNVTGLNSGQGSSTWRVYANDTYGNENISSVTFFVDSLTPLIDYVTPTDANNSYLTRRFILVNVTATDTNLANITIRLSNTTTLINTTTAVTSPLYLNFSLDRDGIYFFNATAVDTLGNRNTTFTRTIIIDTASPSGQYVSPTQASGIFVSNTYIEVNLTANDTNLQTIVIKLYNSTAQINSSSSSTSPFYTNYTGLRQGIHFYNVTINDSAGNIGTLSTRNITIDSIIPFVSISYPLNITYTTTPYGVINYSASDVNLQACWYSTDFGVTNITITCGENVTGLSVSQGSSTWKVYVNDSAGTENVSSVTFLVDSLAPLIDYVTPTETNNSNLSRSYVDVNVTAVDGSLSNITIKIFNNTALVNSSLSTSSPYYVRFTNLLDGVYYFNATAVDTLGNTNTTLTRTVTLDTLGPSFGGFAEHPANNSAYAQGRFYEFNATVLGNPQTVFIEFNNVNYTSIYGSYQFNVSDLAVGTYAYRWHANDSFGNRNNSGMRSYVVSSAVPQGIILNSTPLLVIYPRQTNFSLNENNSGDSDVVYRMYRNNVSVGVSETIILGAGTYVYIANATSGTNYTANASIDSKTLVISQGTGNVSVFVNNAGIDSTIEVGDAIYLNATLVNGSGIIQLYMNGSIINSGTSPLSNLTTFSTAGLYNITAFYSGNENYTSSSKTLYVNVTLDITSPRITINVPQEITYGSEDLPLTFDLTLDENGSIVMYTLNEGSSNVTMSTSDNISYFKSNVSLDDGSYTFVIYANDTSGNRNDTTHVGFTVDTSTSPPGNGNSNGGGGGSGGSVDFSIDKVLISARIKQGEILSDKFKVSNSGTNDANFKIEKTGLDRFLLLNEDSFKLNEGDSKEVGLEMFARENEIPDIYIGKIIISSGSLEKTINVILEVLEKKALFDVRSELHSADLKKGQKLRVNISMINIGDPETEVDVILNYFIKDFNDKIIEIGEETIGVHGQLTIDRKFSIPKELQAGDYLFYVKLTYLNSTATSGSRFTLQEGYSIGAGVGESISSLLTSVKNIALAALAALVTHKSIIFLVILAVFLFGYARAMQPMINKFYLFFTHQRYKMHLIDAKHKARLLDEEAIHMEEYPAYILAQLHSLFYKVYVEYLRIKYEVTSLRVKYELGFYDEDILTVEHLPANIIGTIKGVFYRLYALYLQTKYKIKMSLQDIERLPPHKKKKGRDRSGLEPGFKI